MSNQLDENRRAVTSNALADKAMRARERLTVHSLLLLTVLAMLYTMYLAAGLLIPIVIAVLLYFLLTPIPEKLSRIGVPRAVSSILIILSILVAGSMAIARLSGPAAEWLRDAPTSVAELRGKLRSSNNALRDVRNASEAVEEAVAEITGDDESERDETPEVQIREPGALENVLSRVPMVAASAIVTLILTLFLLIYGNETNRKLVRLGRDFSSRRRILRTIRQVEHDIALYLGSVTVINFCLGCVVAGVMFLIGMPNPLLWGALAAVMNFAPYIGPALTTLTLLFAGVSAYSAMEEMLLPALAFLLLTGLEGQVITPMLLGHRLEMSPVVVLLAVIVFGWIWGIAGALIAVPLVASIRIVLSNTHSFRATASLLSR